MYKQSIFLNSQLQNLSLASRRYKNISCKLLVVGGGSGGCSIAAKFSKNCKKGDIVVVEPNETHYYQALFTLIGGGIKTLADSRRPTKSVLPKNAEWIKDRAVTFKPQDNSVILSNGDKINYDYLIISMGLQLRFEQIPGLEDALQTPYVCSNYSPKYVEKTYKALQNLESGNAIFTYPNSPVKCPGAPQKICYITEDYLRRVGKRNNVNVIYNTSLPVIFGVKTYADALWKVVKKRGITVNLRTNLVKVDPDKRMAYFENLDDPKLKTEFQYSMLHVTPPMSVPRELKHATDLVNSAGFVDVDKDTLQHTKFKNIFALGDCSSSPNSKTAAAVASQSKVVYENLKSVMSGEKPSEVYNGYASCPLVTGYSSCILAEFDYNLQPLETLPIRQDKEMWISYFMKKDILPAIYWHLMLNGFWNGPEIVRKMLHLQFR